VDANEAAADLLESESREAMLGPLDADSIVQDTLESLVDQYVAVWEGTPRVTVDVHGRTLRGNPIDGFLLLAAPTTGQAIDWGSVAIAIVDVSDLHEAQRRLQELIESKDRFVASVSHELRTPLTAVVGLTRELEDAGSEMSGSERDELVRLIAAQAGDVGNIVEDLLVAARADLGTIAIHPEPVDVAAEIRQLVLTLYESSPPVVDAPEGIVAAADPNRLRQVLRNLLTNSQRYGGPHVEVAAYARDGQVLVEVRDDGNGIPAELEELVFEPYETAHAGSGVSGSVGLGLTVSRQLARLMGGDLVYQRSEGSTVFRLTLSAA
jgi:signal transduction histidine kinase